MRLEKLENNDISCVCVHSEEKVIKDVDTALDLLMTARYEFGTSNIIIDKNLIVEDFFILSTRLAGEILQKYINYKGRIAIFGDFSHYTSKPLRDFIYESNKGNDIFFVETKELALDMLTKV